MSPSVKRDLLLLVALYVLNCFFFSAWLQLGDIAESPWLVLVWAYGLLVLVPLFWRDRAPVAVYVIEWVLTVSAWPIMPRFVPVTGIPVALYALAVHRSRKTSLIASLASFIPNGLDAAVAFRIYSSPVEQVRSFVPNAIFLFIVTAGVWGTGRVTRVSQRRVRDLERERETVRQAVTEERRRIARELHDIVSHAVTVIVLQAAGAARIADDNVPQVKQSLKHIEATGKQAMAELRRLLGVLQVAGPVGCSDVSDLEPQPGLKEVTALLDALRDTGMPVTIDVEGVPRSLDPSVDLAAYRIVQEGLTNVLKHAGKDSNPRVRLVWVEHNLSIEIDNDANVDKDHHSQGLSLGGGGLVGLRERAHAVGGALRAGPSHGGGYQLIATLPVVESTLDRSFDETRGVS